MAERYGRTKVAKIITAYDDLDARSASGTWRPQRTP